MDGAWGGLVPLIFALTYLGMAAGRVPGLSIDRAGIALVAALLLVALGTPPAGEIAAAIHFPTLLLMAALMILSARVEAAGIYDLAANWIAGQADRPIRLLALTVAVGGLLSAILINDIVVFALTPLLCQGLMARGLDLRPYLFALAAASNAGSAATLIGNPQNVLIGQVGRLDFLGYLAVAAPPALAALAITFGCIAIVWRGQLAGLAVQSAPAATPLQRHQAGLCLGAILLLLVLFATDLPRELSALFVAGLLLISRKLPSRRLMEGIDVPLLILFAALFVVNDAFARTGLAEQALQALEAEGLLPERLSLLAPLTLLLGNTIGNVPAVMLLLEIWREIPPGVMTALAVLSTLAGNLLLVGSLANLIVAERAARQGLRLTFADHARAGIPITLLSMAAASVWLWALGLLEW